MKTCVKCGVEKPISEFYKDKKSYRTECRVCYIGRALKRYHENKEEISILKKEYVKANPHFSRARTARRRVSKLRASPKWADAEKIKEFYKLAALLSEQEGRRYDVDHIVPLQSKLVCGLHNEFNLRVIPRVENLSKGNRYWPDMP